MEQNTLLLQNFEAIKSEVNLKSYITNKIKEDLYLEFKQKSNSKNGKLDADDKKNFCKVLSGFANSDGGILIWGIQIRASDESAKALKPINQIDQFIRSLKSFLTYSTQPIIDGVRIEKISKDKSKSRGYVKCFIPSSFKAPHRSSYDREYYKRSIEGFYRLEHFDLEDMFGRRIRPVLKTKIETKPHQGEDDKLFELYFYLVNEGRAVAKHAGLFCKFNDNIDIQSVSHSLQDVSKLNNKPSISFSDNNGVIHPNNIYVTAGFIVFKKKKQSQKIIGDLSYYCDGMLAQGLHFEI